MISLWKYLALFKWYPWIVLFSRLLFNQFFQFWNQFWTSWRGLKILEKFSKVLNKFWNSWKGLKSLEKFSIVLNKFWNSWKCQKSLEKFFKNRNLENVLEKKKYLTRGWSRTELVFSLVYCFLFPQKTYWKFRFNEKGKFTWGKLNQTNSFYCTIDKNRSLNDDWETSNICFLRPK